VKNGREGKENSGKHLEAKLLKASDGEEIMEGSKLVFLKK
jgi:hypothetical protein